MDSARWMNVLLEWIKQTKFIDIQENILERTDINEFYNHFKSQLLPDVELAGDITDFIKMYFVDFEIHMDDNNQISSLDYMYIYSIFLYFSCVKYPNGFFHKTCNTLAESIQTSIATFFSLLCDSEYINKNAVRKAIHEAVPSLPKVQVYCVDSPMKTPKFLKFSPPTPKTAVLDEKTRELKLLKAQLDSERYDKSFLEVQMKQNEDRITKLLTEQKQYISEIHDLKSRLLNMDDNLSPKSVIKNDIVVKRLRKNASEQDEEITNLRLQLDNLEDDYQNTIEKLTHAQDHIRTLSDNSKDLEMTMEELKIQMLNKNEQLRCLEETNKDLQSFINETRSNLTTKDILNMSAECLDFSFSQQTTNTSGGSAEIGRSPENLARSVIDLQLREKDNEIKVLHDSLFILKKENETVLKNLNIFLSKYAGPSTENISIIDKVQALSEAFTNINDINTKIKTDNNLLKEQFESLKENVELLKEEKNTLNVRLQKSEESHRLLNDKFATINQEYISLNNSYVESQFQSSNYEIKISNLQENLESQINETKSYKECLDNCSKDKLVMEEKLCTVSQELNTRSAELLDVQRKYDDEASCLSKLEMLLNDINDEHVSKTFIDEKDDLLLKFSRLITALNEQTNKSNEMFTANENLENKLLNYEKSLNEIKGANGILTSNITSAKETIFILESDINELRLKYTELEKSNEDLKSNGCKLTEELQESITKNENVTKEKKDLFASFEKVTEEFNQLKSNHDGLIIEINSIGAEKTEYADKLSKIETQYAEIEVKYQKMCTDFENIALSLQRANENSSMLTNRNNELNDKLQTLEEEQNNINNSKSTLERKLEDTVEERDKLKGDLEQSTLIIENIKIKIAEDHLKNDEMNLRLIELQKMYDNVTTENITLKENNVELFANIKDLQTKYDESVKHSELNNSEKELLQEKNKALQEKYHHSEAQLVNIKKEAVEESKVVQEQLKKEIESTRVELQQETSDLKKRLIEETEKTFVIERLLDECNMKIGNLHLKNNDLVSNLKNLALEKTNVLNERNAVILRNEEINCGLIEHKNKLVQTIEENTNLNIFIKQLQIQIEILVAERDNLKVQSSQLQHQLETTQESMQSQLIEMKNDFEKIECTENHLNTELSNLKIEHVRDLTVHSEKVQELENFNETLKNKCSELEQDISHSHSKLTTLCESFTNSTVENKELKELNNELILRSSDLEKKIHDMTNELVDVKLFNDELNSSLRELNNKMSNLDKQLLEYDQFKEKHFNCEQRLNEVTTNMTTLRDEKENLEQKLGDFKTQHDYLNVEYEQIVCREQEAKTEYEDKLKTLDLKYGSLIQNMDAKEKQIVELKKEMDVLKENTESVKLEKIHILEEKLELDNDLIETKLENSVLADKVHQLESTSKAVESKYLNLVKDHEQLSNEVDTIRSNLKCHSENANELEGIIQIFKEEYNKIVGYIQCEDSQLTLSSSLDSNEVKDYLSKLNKTLIKLKSDFGEANEQKNILERKVQQYSEEKIGWEGEKSELTEKYMQSEELLNKITQQLQEFERDHSKTNINYIEMQSNFSKINDRYKTLENYFEELKNKMEIKTKAYDELMLENSKLSQSQSETEINLKDKCDELVQSSKLIENLKEEVKIRQDHIASLDRELKSKTENVKLQKQSSCELQSSVSLQKTKIEFLEKQLNQKEKSNVEENQRIAELLHQIEKYKSYEVKIVELERVHTKAKEFTDGLINDNNILQAKLGKHRQLSEAKDLEQKGEIAKLQKVIEENKLEEYNKIKEQRFEYEGKLEKMKEKMKSLFSEEMIKIKTKHDKEMHEVKNENVRKISEFEIQKEKLSKQIYTLNMKNLELRKDNELIAMKLKIRENTARESNLKRSTISSSTQMLGTNFKMEDEEGELFNNTYLADLQNGRMSDYPDNFKIEELQMRNSMVPPHLRSAYAVQYNNQDIAEDDIKDGFTNNLDDSSASLLTNGQRKKMSGTTSYKRPGPPTPSKNGGRLSFGGNGDPQYREILKDSNKKATPGKLKSLFSSSSKVSGNNNAAIKDENTTPKRRLSIFGRQRR